LWFSLHDAILKEYPIQTYIQYFCVFQRKKPSRLKGRLLSLGAPRETFHTLAITVYQMYSPSKNLVDVSQHRSNNVTIHARMASRNVKTWKTQHLEKKEEEAKILRVHQTWNLPFTLMLQIVLSSTDKETYSWTHHGRHSLTDWHCITKIKADIWPTSENQQLQANQTRIFIMGAYLGSECWS
jgi:hypothetical protein